MKNQRIYLLVFILASVFTYQMALRNSVIAVRSHPVDVDETVYYQVTPTETPLSSIDDEVLTTDPIQLQIIILFGIVAVLIIFIGVWINQRQVDIK
jgi:hypothetical protein